VTIIPALFPTNREEGINKIYFSLEAVVRSNGAKGEVMVCVPYIVQDKLEIFIE
jgi:hypothetical protein